MKEKFNPEEWLSQEVAPSNKQYAPDSDNIDDIEQITQRIESAQVDITAGYDNWRDIGFALSDELGENGREIFHRVSRFNPDYNQQDCDRQYDRCLRSHGSGITIKSFFQKAKESGISLVTKSAKSATSAISAHRISADKKEEHTFKSANTNNADIADYVETADIATNEILPTFSQDIREHLPSFLKKIDSVSNSDFDADILTLGAITVLSSCMPHIHGIYDGRIVYPNIFLFVTARASSGKGRLTLCRYLVEPIHDRLREINEAEMMEYKQKLAEYNAAGKKKATMEKPDEPPLRMLFIPANSSATAVYQVLDDNGGQGLMFETEGDTLANTFGSDYGNYSDGFRKAFHHETISYVRRKDREYVNIKHPRLSTLLTGTPRQILNLISDAENGLFSRFAFYYLNIPVVWNNVFGQNTSGTLDECFQKLGAEYHDLYNILNGKNSDIVFSFSYEQQYDFNKTFAQWQEECLEECGEEFVASVRRLGVIMFRIAMCISVLRLMEDGNFEENIVCLDIDYQTAKRITSVILQHNIKVFMTLPTITATSQPSKGTERTRQKQDFWNKLPDEFDRKTYSQIAESLGLNPKSIDRTVRKWCDEGKLENTAHGQYAKCK